MSDDRTTVDIAVGLRGEEWWPKGVMMVDAFYGFNLDRIAWAAAVWLWTQGWVSEGTNMIPDAGKPEWRSLRWDLDSDHDPVTDPDPIRATLLAAEAAREQQS